MDAKSTRAASSRNGEKYKWQFISMKPRVTRSQLAFISNFDCRHYHSDLFTASHCDLAQHSTVLLNSQVIHHRTDTQVYPIQSKLLAAETFSKSASLLFCHERSGESSDPATISIESS
jgi:hypothetical protein